MDSKQTNPIQDLFVDVKKIIEFIETKDNNAATLGETDETKNSSQMWINARLGIDTYTTYAAFWNIAMFQDVLPNAKLNNIGFWMENPFNVPLDFRDALLTKGRELFLDSYEEKNPYYRMLNGLPDYETPSSEFIYLSKETASALHTTTDVPIHELSTLVQNSFMSTDEYTDLVNNNPDKKYLKYIGLNKIDILSARRAKDFEIIRYPNNRSDINPNLLKKFGILYSNYREYVMTTLYNPKFEELYDNYRTFMGLLISSFTLLQISNAALESFHDRKFLDDTVLHIMLSMYDIPKTLLMTNEVRRNLVINMLKLTREKGTDDVYYDLINILGYQDIIISKLMLVKNQNFDNFNNDKVLFEDGKALNTFENMNTVGIDNQHLQVKPQFAQIDLLDKTPFDTIINGKAPMHDVKAITDADPTWWDFDDTQNMLNHMEYSIADSKYIMVEAVIHQIKYLFESIYFTRLIIDNIKTTDNFMINIPELFGIEEVSVYDLVIYILAATCMNNNLSGKIINDESTVLATAGFNFDIDLDLFKAFIDTTRYIDKNKVMAFVEDLNMHDKSDIDRLFNDVMQPMREWLELKITRSINRKEYLEYESIYRSLFTYDITKSNILKDFQMPMIIIRDKYSLSDDDMLAFKHFYPRTMTGEAITEEKFYSSRYNNPFLARNYEVTWFIHLIIDTPAGKEDRGIIYFHDILNCSDVRELANPNGTRILMDWESNENGWEVNETAVETLVLALQALKEDELKSAYFQIDTPVLNSNGKVFKANEKLPADVRNGSFKEILIDKVNMDILGLCVPPVTYLEYLDRKNEKLYDLLTKGNRFVNNKDAWLVDVMKVVTVLETELNVHMKYFEQSVVGSDLFFKPLVTLIKHFKSTFVDFAKTGLKYNMDDKIDSGGNSNMFKIFDELKLIIHFVVLARRGYDSQFGLYDTEHRLIQHILLQDKSDMITESLADGLDVVQRKSSTGSLRIVDEAKFFKNGKETDPDGNISYWRAGEVNIGRWANDEDFISKTRTSTERIKSNKIDKNSWKEFVETNKP